jgi:hypoxanthine phosphoribosyltransferase
MMTPHISEIMRQKDQECIQAILKSLSHCPYTYMITDSFPVDLVSWDYAISLSGSLAAMIRASRFTPDIVIAIGRGGYVPARIVCDRLLMTDLTSIKIEHWGTAGHKLDQARVRFPLSVNVEEKNLLVIDDITDTGETLMAAREYLAPFAPGEIRTGVLQHKTSSAYQPDYYAELLSDWKWIVYPWALHEDMIGFLEKVLSPRPASAGELVETLRLRFMMNPDMDEVILALNDMVSLEMVSRQRDLYYVPGSTETPESE